ncbi:MAG: hypothetical protein QM749_07700 [Aquabacterium sp.]
MKDALISNGRGVLLCALLYQLLPSSVDARHRVGNITTIRELT